MKDAFTLTAEEIAVLLNDHFVAVKVEKATAYVCRDHSCNRPVTSVNEMMAFLDQTGYEVAEK